MLTSAVMIVRPTPRVLAACLFVVAATPLLPISEAEVVHHTSMRLARDVLPAFFEEESAPKEVVWSWSGDEAVGREIRAAFMRHNYAVIVPEGTSKFELELELREEGSDLVFEAALGELYEVKKARKGSLLSLVPPLVAVLLALLFKNIIVSLFLGVWAGVTILEGGNPILGLWLTFSEYIRGVVSDSFNLQILGFTFGLVGMVGVIGRMGGTQGLVNAVSRFAKGPRSAQGVTGFMGTLIFFDDYANTMIVGTTARALTDKMRVSREKLAYIVDSTSAPIAGIAIISTWIGYEVGLFESLLAEFAHVDGVPSSGYELFFEVLPLRFYCLFALALVFLTALTGRDLGSMFHAERRVRSGGPVVPPLVGQEAGERARDAGIVSIAKAGVTPRLINAVIPILSVLGFIGYSVVDAGSGAVEGAFDRFSLEHWRLVFSTGAEDIGFILFLASLLGGGVAIALALIQGLLSPWEVVTAYGGGVLTLLEAAGILVLAWVIKNVCDDLGTGLALVGIVGTAVPVVVLPLLIFALSGVVAFSTGTSWGTMALLLPVAAPLAAVISGELPIILACMGAVLDGAIWGDHCSPISDTTVLSSTATGCPHLAHVKTQMPYAMLAMVMAGGVGYLGYAAGLPCAVIYPIGILGMLGVLLALGRNPDQACD